MEDTIGEDIKRKEGPELFRELLRQLPLVHPEDYLKNGVWLNDLMRIDIRILVAHRMEAGAPDPPPLEEIKVPELPHVPKPGILLQSPAAMKAVGAAGPFRPLLPPGMATTVGPAGSSVAGVLAPGMLGAAKAAGVQTVAPPGVVLPPGSLNAVAAGMAGAAGSIADLRQIALFVSKWRLEPARTKMLLEKLSPPRRHYVMQNFKDTAAINGVTPVSKLEEYITQCEQSGVWEILGEASGSHAGAVVAPPVSKGAVVVPPAGLTTGTTAALLAQAAGQKRPFDQLSGSLSAAAAAQMPREVRPRPAGTVVLPPGVSAAAGAAPKVAPPMWKSAMPTGPGPAAPQGQTWTPGAIRPGQIWPAASCAR